MVKVTGDTVLTPLEEQVWLVLGAVNDPEVPVLSILDLGIVRQVHVADDATGTASVQVTITPTYTGCPAMDVIRMSIRMALLQAGFKQIDIITTLSPAWTTDWLTPAGRQKLQAYGIAPPQGRARPSGELFAEDTPVACPHCRSHHTQLLSQFGSTACKALYQCLDCKEPFDYFKCH